LLLFNNWPIIVKYHFFILQICHFRVTVSTISSLGLTVGYRNPNPNPCCFWKNAITGSLTCRFTTSTLFTSHSFALTIDIWISPYWVFASGFPYFSLLYNLLCSTVLLHRFQPFQKFWKTWPLTTQTLIWRLAFVKLLVHQNLKLSFDYILNKLDKFEIIK